MDATHSTSYYATDSAIMTELASPESMATITRMAGFPVDFVDVHHCLTESYNRVVGYAMASGKYPVDLRSDIVRHTVDALRVRNEYATGYADLYARDYESSYTRRRDPERVAPRSTPRLPPPRPADTYALNTRHAVAPRSNRSLTPHELRQMRGVATAGVAECITGSRVSIPTVRQ